MVRSITTAIGAVCLTAGLFGIADAKTHTVVPGETLAIVAQREHIGLDQLTRVNDLDGAADRPLAAGTVLGLDEAAALPASTGDVDRERAELQEALTASPAVSADTALWTAGSPVHAARAAAGEAGPLHRLASRIMRRSSSLAVSLTKSAMQYIGTPYVFGGTSPSGFDCSGYTQHIFAALGIRIPRTADAQYYAGSRIAGGLVTGDLVFFQTYEPGPSHVGIYLGNGNFIHSSSHGVRVSALSESYWSSRYLGAKRFLRI